MRAPGSARLEPSSQLPADLGATWEPWLDFTGSVPAGDPTLSAGDSGLVVDEDEVVHIIWADWYTSCCPAMDRYYTRLE